ncbi:MAG: BrnT family toxin [Cardiobacteriaceae bacterium]|nr:BrnT family toxin [Cardiobacteriaceae bacterium]
MKIKGFDWDHGNWPKCGKHGVSREEIERLFLDGKAFVTPDIKHSTQQESRHIAAGKVCGRALFVAFVIRNNHIRPVSARYMHEKEARNYEAST